MKYRKQHIEVPIEIRHFNSSNYRRSGIKDIVNLDDYVETIVQLVDARNAEQEIDGWRDERSFRELMDFSDYLLIPQRNLIQRCRGIPCSIQPHQVFRDVTGIEEETCISKVSKKGTR